MKTFSTMMVGLVMLLVAGCAGGVGPTTDAPTVDVTGKWAGTWVVTTSWAVLGYQQGGVGSGSIQMTLTQTGSEYTGTLLATGSVDKSTACPWCPCPTNPSGPMQGIVSGNQVRVRQPSNMTGSLTVQGDSMTGTVQCGRLLPGSHDRGGLEANVTLTRQK